MSVRVVARIRPLLKAEIEKDVIVEAVKSVADTADNKSIVRIPNPKKDSEAFSFQFNSVYDHEATQAQLFDNEVSPTVKHLFKGCDVTLFAYGVTGTGKTHTMRGGKAMADRGVIPRLLSSIYRRARKVEKDSDGETSVEVSMSYYEIYCDRVYDLFEPPEKRTPAGLPIRDIGNGKTQVVGLTERPCSSLKEFELLYDQANVNRSTSATKLNAHSSRSHAILCVNITQTTGASSRTSTASAIDLAGSEDNRRTDNNKARLVESASINKSLFVLAQCVEAISKKAARIPYRESKMTRILCLGQNQGVTVMILNLAPVRSYHLDTVSSLNFANRTKKIEVNEVENVPFFREQPQSKNGAEGKDGEKAAAPHTTFGLHRRPLHSKILSQRTTGGLLDVATAPKPTKQFAVFSDQPRPSANSLSQRGGLLKSPKRTSSEAVPTLGRPSKISRLHEPAAKPSAGLSAEAIEALIERKVSEALAERVEQSTVSTGPAVDEEVARRLEALEKRVQGQRSGGEAERAEGLQYLLMAKQHQVRGEEGSALKMYELALPYFGGNEKLVRKIEGLRERVDGRRRTGSRDGGVALPVESEMGAREARRSVQGGVALPKEFGGVEQLDTTKLVEREPTRRKRIANEDDDESFHSPTHGHDQDDDEDDDEDIISRPRTKIRRQRPHLHSRSLTAPFLTATTLSHSPSSEEDEASNPFPPTSSHTQQTPRTKTLLRIINTRDVNQIQTLRGVGKKKAEGIVECLIDLFPSQEDGVRSLGQLGGLKGVGSRGVEKMREGFGDIVL